MKIPVTQTPQDVYALASIASATKVQIQNRSTTDVRIYAGSAAPASLDDYFDLPAKEHHEYIGTVIMVYSGQKASLIVQAGV